MGILTSLVHFLGGVLTALVTTKFTVLGLVMLILFIIYELDERWHLSDESYRDILEYMIGVYVVAFVIFVWNVIQ